MSLRILLAPLPIPDFYSCCFRFTTGRHRVHQQETDATLRKRSSLSRAARLVACCPGWSPLATTHWTSAWSMGKGRAQPAPTGSSIPQKEVGWTCHWDPSSVWCILRDFAWPMGPQRKYILEAQCDFPTDEHSTHRADRVSARLWPEGVGKASEASLKPPFSWLKIFLHS